MMGQITIAGDDRPGSLNQMPCRCNDGWMCEEHEGQPWRHSGCGGAGIPCESPDCNLSIKKTGLVCPRCLRSFGDIEMQTARVVRFKCKACSYEWWAETPSPDNLKRH